MVRKNTSQKMQGKKRTSKIIDRLTYSPKKHKNKKLREMRKKLQTMNCPQNDTPVTKETLKFGSFNVNGLDIEARWAVEQLVNTKGFDVSIHNSGGLESKVNTNHVVKAPPTQHHRLLKKKKKYC